ncbi:MAG: hypothetical protein ACOX3G_10060 [Armatimonadota bacterium]
MFRLTRIGVIIAVFSILMAATACAAPKKVVKPAPKPAPKAAAPKVAPVVIPTGPKYLKVVAVEPFEAVPSTGPNKMTASGCPEQIVPMTFTASFGKPLNVILKGADLIGPGKITADNVTIKLISGDDLLPAQDVEIGPGVAHFWVDVNIPRGTKPGLYRGYVSVVYQEKQWDVVPIELNVIAMRLIGSSKQYALYTSLTPFGEGDSTVGAETYAELVRSVAAMGFRAIAVNAAPENMADVLRTCSSAGLLGGTPVLAFASGCELPSIEDVKAVEAAKRAAGITTTFQFCANNPCSEEETSAAIEKARLFKQAGCQVAATVSDPDTAEKLLPVCQAINYNIDMPYVQALINGGNDRTTKWEWYWWDARKSVRDNRINSGIALWRSGLYGCMPFWMPQGEGDQPTRLDSMLCMAMREGVVDTRYITTYMKALRELKDKKRQADKDYIASTESYLAAFLVKPLDKLTPADLRGFRLKMVEFTNKLEARL